MRYVYLLSVYDEYGAKQVRATTDRRAVVRLLTERPWHDYDVKPGHVDALNEFLEDTDANLAGTNKNDPMGCGLSNGWGGFQFYVVPLEE